MRSDSKNLPKQMVVILSPKPEVFDQVTTKLENAINKDDRSLIYDIIQKLQKDQMKKNKEKEIKEKQDDLEFKRVVDEEESNQMEDTIKDMVEQFISTYDDPMGSILKLL